MAVAAETLFWALRDQKIPSDNVGATMRRVRELLDSVSSPALIEIDGGVDQSNVSDVVAAGANILVAGQAVFGTSDPESATRALRASANQLVGG